MIAIEAKKERKKIGFSSKSKAFLAFIFLFGQLLLSIQILHWQY